MNKDNDADSSYVGIDISKAKLDVCFGTKSDTQTFDNSTAGITKLFKALAKRSTCHLVCEATGGYERLLVTRAQKADIVLSVVNPRAVRDFARAAGRLAKTDAIDAQTLVDYGTTFKPRAEHHSDATQQTLRDLSRRREHLVSQRIREKNALEKAHDPFVTKNIRATIVFLNRQVKACDARLREIISADKKLKEKQERLQQVQGIGPVCATSMLAEVPELGKISDKQAASLLGLAPFNRDSGQWRGSRTIQGGRGIARRALYMPALCAMTHNPILKEFYQRLRAKGKAHYVALTAVMRKLGCLVNRILSDAEFELQGTENDHSKAAAKC
jgi:transposase